MATINYFVKGKSTLSQIYVRIREGRHIDLTTKTQLVVDANNWSLKKGGIKQTSSFQEKRNLQIKLDQLESNLNDQIHKAKLIGTELTKEWLEDCIDAFHGKVKVESSELIKVIENHVISLQTRLKNVGIQTTKGFGTTNSHIKKYQIFKKKKFHLFDVDYNFLQSFITFLKEKEGYASSTINKDISRIIQVCKSSKLKGLEVNESIFLAKYSSSKPQRHIVTLSKEELEQIGKFKGSDYLENVRDWLIIGCWTGCRIGDLMNLKTENIITKPDGKKVIRYIQTKTKKEVELLMHKEIEKIIERLKGFPRPIKDSNFNLYIKNLCEKVGIIEEMKGEKMNPKTKRKETGTFPKFELITSHICRRSFATNHYTLLSNKIIMRVTGHATERQFLEYIGEIDDNHLDAFENLYNSIEK